MTLYHITLQVALRKDILDPAGRAVCSSLNNMGISAQDVRIGKNITLSLAAENADEAETCAHKMAEKLLVNAVMEDYTLTVTPAFSG